MGMASGVVISTLVITFIKESKLRLPSKLNLIIAGLSNDTAAFKLVIVMGDSLTAASNSACVV